MTALLAFFIVLNSLAEDQTGANLHSGTGSFVSALNSFGLPTRISGDRSRQAIQHQEHSPQYVVGSDDEDVSRTESVGPDDTANADRVIDREQEDWQRFLRSVRSTHSVTSSERESADVTFDFFVPLNQDPPYLPAETRKALDRLIPAIDRPNFEIELTVWASTPGASAWTRATDRASAMADEVSGIYQLNADQRRRVRGIGRPWLSPTARRPVVSVTVRKSVESPRR